MRINLKTTNIEIGNDTREYLMKKLESLSKFLDKDDESIIFDVEVGRTTKHHQSGEIFMAEININSRSGNFRTVCEKKDLNSAIDKSRDEMALILGKNKKKRFDFVKRGGQKIKNLFKRFYK